MSNYYELWVFRIVITYIILLGHDAGSGRGRGSAQGLGSDKVQREIHCNSPSSKDAGSNSNLPTGGVVVGMEGEVCL